MMKVNAHHTMTNMTTMPTRRPRPLLLALLLLLLAAALLLAPAPTAAQRGGTPPSTDTLGASCNRYPPRHHSPCLAATQSHLRSDPSGPASAAANKLPASSVSKITAFLLTAKPVNAQDASKRSAHVSKRLARAMADAAKADASSSSSSASTTATASAVMQVLLDTRFAPVLLYDDAEGKPAARALEVSARSGHPPLHVDLDAFSAHAIVRTVSGVFTCYDSEQAAAANDGPTPCDMQTLHRLIQLVDVLTAWLDSVRSRAPMAEQLESSGASTLGHFLAGLKGDRDQVTARAIILDLVTSSLTASLAPDAAAASGDDKAKNAATARTLLDVYYLPLHYYSARRPGKASEREAREAAWRAMARVQTLGAAVRKTKAEHAFWFGLMKSGVQWVLGPVAKMMLRGSLEAKVEHGEL